MNPGDLVIGNAVSRGKYIWTDDRSICKVIEFLPDEKMLILLIDRVDPETKKSIKMQVSSYDDIIPYRMFTVSRNDFRLLSRSERSEWLAEKV